MLLSISTQSALGDKLFQALKLFRLIWQAQFGYVSSLQQILEWENQATGQFNDLVAMTDSTEYHLSPTQKYWLDGMISRFNELQVFLNIKYKQLYHIELAIKDSEILSDLPVELNKATQNTYLRTVLREKRTKIFQDSIKK